MLEKEDRIDAIYPIGIDPVSPRCHQSDMNFNYYSLSEKFQQI